MSILQFRIETVHLMKIFYISQTCSENLCGKLSIGNNLTISWSIIAVLPEYFTKILADSIYHRLLFTSKSIRVLQQGFKPMDKTVLSRAG